MPKLPRRPRTLRATRSAIVGGFVTVTGQTTMELNLRLARTADA